MGYSRVVNCTAKSVKCFENIDVQKNKTALEHTNDEDEHMIEPFANNHQSMQIGELVIENQEDKIIIYGDIDLTLDASGYEQAQKLHELTGRIVDAFQVNSLYSNNDSKSKENDDQLGKDIDNPFL